MKIKNKLYRMLTHSTRELCEAKRREVRFLYSRRLAVSYNQTDQSASWSAKPQPETSGPASPTARWSDLLLGANDWSDAHQSHTASTFNRRKCAQ